jgi:Ca2+-binding RTX toxin-like protein
MSEVLVNLNDPNTGTSNASGGKDIELDIQASPTGPHRVAGTFNSDRISFNDFSNNSIDIVSAAQGDDVVATGAGNDSIAGGDGNDLMNGGQGSDTLEDGFGNDIIFGGQGDDIISDNAGNNILIGNFGNDSIRGGLDTDIAFGNQGNDTLDGGSGNDSLYGGRDADSLSGGAGNDFLSEDRGSGTLTGGAGSDTFAFNWYGDSEAFAGVDTITDFEPGTDKIAIDANADPGFNPGDTLPASEFSTVSGASDADIDTNEAKVVYDQDSGSVYYNPSQSGGDLQKMAELENQPDINNTDFEFL